MEFIRTILFDNLDIIEALNETGNISLIYSFIFDKINDIDKNQMDEMALTISDIDNLLCEIL